MEGSRLRKALELLRHHYGEPPVQRESGSWRSLVETVARGSVETDAGCEAAPLASAASVADCGIEELSEALVKIPRGKQKAPALKSLARWWLSRFGDTAESEWDGAIEELRQELLALRGVSLETADRLLLFVGRLPAYPVDRASIRIAARHGWLGTDSEYDEWQTFFVRGLDESVPELQRASLLIGRTGRDFCGPVPRCDKCPLQELLPPGGPYESGD